MPYESVSSRNDLNEEEKQAERNKRSAWRRQWINIDINGKSIAERLERLEGIVLGQEPPPTP
jgi:hypothetical protein